ncbi:MAG: L-2-hydroxyglutarate oxidase [Rhodospirillales bacterium]
MNIYDIVIIGGGIVGTSVAWQLRQAWPTSEILLIDKEDAVARHQTGRNSGVIHAGLYYQPGSMKARFCREGVAASIWLSKEYGIRFEQCGKLVVATHDDEMNRLGAIFENSKTNGIQVEMLDKAAFRELEPRITGVGAILSPSTGIADYAGINRCYAKQFEGNRGEILFNTEVRDLVEDMDAITIVTDGAEIRTRYLIVCAGLQADRLAGMMGLADDFRIIPFRGEYYSLGPEKNDIVQHLIYPVPNPGLPFLGVHLTRMIEGNVTLGPNAVFSLAREAYDANRLSIRDFLSSVSWGGFWKLAATYPTHGVKEFYNSISKRRYLSLCQRYCPELTLEDMHPHRTGIRAQAVDRNGVMIHDFMIKSSKRAVHVCNAPSPAATSSLPIGRHILGVANETFDLGLDLAPPPWPVPEPLRN